MPSDTTTSVVTPSVLEDLSDAEIRLVLEHEITAAVTRIRSRYNWRQRRRLKFRICEYDSWQVENKFSPEIVWDGSLPEVWMDARGVLSTEAGIIALTDAGGHPRNQHLFTHRYALQMITLGVTKVVRD